MFNIFFATFKPSQILITMFTFIYIYTPLLILPFNILHIISVVSIWLLFLNYSASALRVMASTEIRVFLVLQLILAIYVTTLSALTSQDFLTLYFAVSTIIEVVPCAILISLFLLRRNFNMLQFYEFILNIGLIQVFFVIATFLFPSLRDWIIQSSGSSSLEEVYQLVNKFRIFGLARGYTFAMPLFQGMCIIIAMVLGSYVAKKYYLLVPFYLISILLNARIAAISLIISFLVIMSHKLKRNFFKQIGSALLFVGVFYLLNLYIKEKAEDSLNDIYIWLNFGIQEVTSFMQSKESSGNIETLQGMWFIPPGMGLLAGTGKNVFGIQNNSSDIGYVINLYYGGIIFSLILYFAYLFLLNEYRRRGNLIEKNIGLSLIVYLAFANIKGNVFVPSEIINGLILLIIFSVSYRIKRRENEFNSMLLKPSINLVGSR